jgi:hypothetical protein
MKIAKYPIFRRVLRNILWFLVFQASQNRTRIACFGRESPNEVPGLAGLAQEFTFTEFRFLKSNEGGDSVEPGVHTGGMFVAGCARSPRPGGY